MNKTENQMIGMLLRLRFKVHGDFAGYAVAEEGGRFYRWMHLSGSVSGRCEAMTFRMGAGVGGQTLRIGKTVIWNTGAAETERLRRECPLMQAEALCSAISAPVKNNGAFRGVIVVGRRTDRTFTQSDTDSVQRDIEMVADIK